MERQSARHAPVVIAARRTPVASIGRGLATVEVADLAAPVLAALADDLRAFGLEAPVDDVVLGNVMGPGGNPARVAALAAGLGTAVPGTTVDRQCGSGQEAVHVAAASVAAGAASIVLAGGAESASTAPHRLRLDPGGGAPIRYDRAPFAPQAFGDPDMGPAAQDVADRYGVTRERQDAYAVRSFDRTMGAIAAGEFSEEIVPVNGMSADDRPRRVRSDLLARFPGAFTVGGSVTAGNSCGVSDGAAALAVVNEQTRSALGVAGLAIRGWTAAGVDPRTPGIGPVPAVRELLRRNGVGVDELAAIEMTEAFAAQVLACTDQLDLDPLGSDDDRFCRQGGAIALGHPWGASGALLLVRLFSQLVRTEIGSGATGLATCAVGGGQGLAMLVERVG